jgi:hypothetical protein
MRAQFHIATLVVATLTALAAQAQPLSAPPGAAVSPVTPALGGAAPVVAAPVSPAPRVGRAPASAQATSLTIVNARSVAATQVMAEAAGRTSTLAKPVAPNGRAVLRLPATRSCTINLTVTFADGETSDVQDHDACLDRIVRLTD